MIIYYRFFFDLTIKNILKKEELIYCNILTEFSLEMKKFEIYRLIKRSFDYPNWSDNKLEICLRRWKEDEKRDENLNQLETFMKNT